MLGHAGIWTWDHLIKTWWITSRPSSSSSNVERQTCHKSKLCLACGQWSTQCSDRVLYGWCFVWEHPSPHQWQLLLHPELGFSSFWAEPWPDRSAASAQHWNQESVHCGSLSWDFVFEHFVLGLQVFLFFYARKRSVIGYSFLRMLRELDITTVDQGSNFR